MSESNNPSIPQWTNPELWPAFSRMNEQECLKTIAQNSERLARVLETLASGQAKQTTPVQLVQNVYGSQAREAADLFRETKDRVDPPPAPKATSNPIPDEYKAATAGQDFITLVNGMKAPTHLVMALAKLDATYPESTLPEARAAVVATIVEAQNEKLSTAYPFCMNDDEKIREKASPCILKKGHRGKHKDNDDGVWSV